MKKNLVVLLAGMALSAFSIWGCSSSPSKDELKQLDATKAEIASLTQKESALRQEEATLQQQIDSKKAKLKSCQDDMAAVQLKLKNTN